MNNITKFSHLGVRWGGRVSLLSRVTISRGFLTVMLLLSLLFVVLPTFAQDVVTEIPVVPSGSVDTAIVFAGLAAVVVIGLGGTALIGYLVKRLGDSVPADKIQGILDSAQKYMYNQAMTAAARSPQKWDDDLVPAVAGFFGYNPAVSTPTRTPIPQRPTPSIPPTPAPSSTVAQPIGVPLNSAYDLRRTTFTELPYDEKRVAVPSGYGYYADGGDTAVHTDAFYDPGEGFKMMLDSRGKLDEHGRSAQYGYESLHTVELYPGTRYTIAPHFDAKIAGGAVNIRAALLDGNQVLLELPPQRIEPGTYMDKSVVFVFQLSPQKSIFYLRLRVYIETEYATLHSDSYIRWRTLPLEAQVPDYGNDAVVRY